MGLMLGTAKINITPEIPIPLSGYGDRNGVFEGITRPIYLRVLYFEQNSNQKALIVSADIIWWGSDRIQRIMRKLQTEYGLSDDSIVLHATHNHSGPATSAMFPMIGKIDEAYLDLLEEKLMEGVKKAYFNKELVTIERGTGSCVLGVNRRKKIDGKIKMAPNEEEPIDSQITVFCMKNSAGLTRGVAVHYTCHPTTTGENLISSDFPGKAMSHIESFLEDDGLSVFLQGCCGDVRPKLVKENAFYRGTDHEVCELGKRLSEDICSILEKPMERLEEINVLSGHMKVPLKLQKMPSQQELKEDEKNPAWAQFLLNHPERLKDTLDFEITCIHIAEGFSFLAMNGEMVLEYGLFVKEKFKNRILPVGYSNGMIGYVPTSKQLEEGGYESVDFIYAFALPAPFSSRVEEEIKHNLNVLIQKLGVG